jgi:hypothetical protein
MNNALSLSLLRNGNHVCELVRSEIYPLPEVSKFVSGREVMIVTPLQLDATIRDGFALGLPNGSAIPIEILSSRVGIEGWDSAVRVGFS